MLKGSNRPLIVTAGLPPVASRPAIETDAAADDGSSSRLSEQAAMRLVEQGVQASVVRMSQVHDRNRQGLATYMSAIAREKGFSAYIGDGLNRWSAVHRLDAAFIYRLAIERAIPGARYHAVAEEGIDLRRIAEAVGHRLEVPVSSLPVEAAAAHFGWLAHPVGMDTQASSVITRETLGWKPGNTVGFLEMHEEPNSALGPTWTKTWDRRFEIGSGQEWRIG